MVAMLGFLALVIDAGVFFMIRRELQNTADTAALAGAAWLEPAVNGEPVSTLPPPAPPPQCAGTYGLTDQNRINAAQMACTYGKQNAGTAGKLCLPESPVQMDTPTFDQWQPTPSSSPSPTIIVNFHCVAGYWFGRFIPGLTSRTISAHAEAGLGLRTPGDPNVNPFQNGFNWPTQIRATRLFNS
jgi:hypothetical protein